MDKSRCSRLAKGAEGLDFSKGVSIQRALSSAVEHFLHTEGVAGSNPAARTIPLNFLRSLAPGAGEDAASCLLVFKGEGN
jgi:hypothetical protein